MRWNTPVHRIPKDLVLSPSLLEFQALLLRFFFLLFSFFLLGLAHEPILTALFRGLPL
jgi:hypothetical protein